MYGATIPEDEDAEVMVSKQPSNQAPARRGFGLFGLVVAVCVGVIIGASGTMLLTGGPEAPSPSRAAMELDAESHCGSEVVSCCKKADHALAMCARLPCFPGTCNMDKNIC